MIAVLYLAEWFEVGPDDPGDFAREPFKGEYSWEPIPDLDRPLADGWRRERRGGTAPRKVLGVLGGRMRRVNGRIYLATSRRNNLEPIEVFDALAQQAQDVWELPFGRAGDADPLPPPEDAPPAAEPRPPMPGMKAIHPPGLDPRIGVSVGPPPARKPAKATQLGLFGEDE